MTVNVVDHKKKQEEALRQIEEELAGLAGGLLNEGTAFEEYDGQKVVKPRDMSYATLAKLAADKAAADEKEEMFSHTFKMARPWDGAYSLQLTLKRVFGLTGSGITQFDMFGGEHPPQKIDVEVDVNKTVQIPWGVFGFPLLEAEFTTASENLESFGPVFKLYVKAPLKKARVIEGLFQEIEKTLETESIYRGKCFVGTTNPEFFDPNVVDRSTIVFNRDVERDLDLLVWGPIATADLQIADGLPINTRFLLFGKFGTGKTSCAAIAAQEAKKSGFTTIQTKPGASLDEVADTLRMATLYAPSVAIIEDVDRVAKPGDDVANSRLLEMFDGISAKGHDVMILMTSNHEAEVHKGMMRPGRTDGAVELPPLDREAVERLISVSVPSGKLDQTTDYDQVHEAMEGFEPAFVKGTFTMARRAAISRLRSLEYKLNHDDFVAAARMLRPLHDMHERAKDQFAKTTIEDRIGGLIAGEFDTREITYDEETGNNRLTRISE